MIYFKEDFSEMDDLTSGPFSLYELNTPAMTCL